MFQSIKKTNDGGFLTKERRQGVPRNFRKLQEYCQRARRVTIVQPLETHEAHVDKQIQEQVAKSGNDVSKAS